MQLSDEFSQHCVTALSLSKVATGEAEPSDLKDIYVTYSKFLNCSEEELVNQFHIYQKNKNKVTTLQNLLCEIPVARFPIICKLVRIAVTLPVTSCEPERCFSALKIFEVTG